MNGKVNKKVDGLLNLLLKYETNTFFTRQTKELMWKYKRKEAREKEGHQLGSCISDKDFKVIQHTHAGFHEVVGSHHPLKACKNWCALQYYQCTNLTDFRWWPTPLGHVSLRGRKKKVCKINLVQSSCCHESCYLKCSYMDCKSLCRHMYTCERIDNTNGHICKHLHGLHIWLRSHGDSLPIDNPDTSKVIEYC